MLEPVVLAAALAMDAAAVAAARSVAGIRHVQLLSLAVAFGAFQAGIAALGWWLGATAATWVASWDHWIAIGLLVAIGAKMLVEADCHGRDDAAPPPTVTVSALLLLAVATSIDALAAGVTLPMLGAPVLVSVILIGGVTLLLSLLAGLAGSALGRRAGRRLEVAGGVALIAIGIKTLFDHLTGT